MDMDRVRIADVITAEYSDFLSFCSASGKIFISELTNVDFVAFRTSSGQSRDYIKSIRAMLDNPVVVATTEVDAVRKGSESEKNELQGVLFDAGKYLALEDQSTPSKTESPSWIQPTEQPVKNLEAVLDETSCSDTENDTENETADRTTEEFVVTSIGTETTASSSTGPSDDSEYTLAFMYRNDFEDRNKLFAALNYMFREEFSFSRPYIAKLGVNDISNRSVILQHIEDYDSIEIEELIDICDENGIHYVAPAYLCQMIAPDFIRVNRTTLMRRELTGITDEVIEQANSIIRDLLEVNGYIVGSKVNDFLWYPQIDIDWTEFLLENLIVQSKKINVVYMFGDPLQHPNAIYVAEEFGKDTFDSFLIKILTEEVHKGSFTSKVEMRDWLREEGMIEAKLPNFLESAKYFYVNETGVHCTGE